MKILKNPSLERLVLQRPADEQAATRRTAVAELLDQVRREGDRAVKQLAERFDGFAPAQLEVEAGAFERAEAVLSDELKNAIQLAYRNIRTFHERQQEPEWTVETMPGVQCSRRSIPIDRVGLYIPGGTAPLFSTVLMLGVPAQLAGCQQVVLCTPPQSNGEVHPAVLYCAQLCGIRRVFRIGGVQAIGAMAYGTETVPRVWKIFGPGNAWVTAAKQLVSLDGVAIDLPAGPSEVCVVADHTANPVFVAADLLSQAEHGADSQVLLLTTSSDLMDHISEELERQLADLPRAEVARQALAHSTAILVNTLDEAMYISNGYAPEHLILQVENPEQWAGKVRQAGSVFLGHFTPESAGDYASGTNHTLPTSGYARAYAGVSLDSFVKKITFQHIQPDGLVHIGPAIIAMARAEGLEAHARAVSLRESERVRE
ncbi:MAG: histidinol dehydrogenase [Bacteroidetes bacterium]|nr:histidinol dehydrogenase [Bacteroidota bacterium]